MVAGRGIERTAETVCEEIAGDEHEIGVRQRVHHLLQGRAQQHPIGVPTVAAEARIGRGLEDGPPLIRLGRSQSIDLTWISHRVEMQIRHHQELPGNSWRCLGRLSVCRSG